MLKPMNHESESPAPRATCAGDIAIPFEKLIWNRRDLAPIDLRRHLRCRAEVVILAHLDPIRPQRRHLPHEARSLGRRTPGDSAGFWRFGATAELVLKGLEPVA